MMPMRQAEGVSWVRRLWAGWDACRMRRLAVDLVVLAAIVALFAWLKWPAAS